METNELLNNQRLLIYELLFATLQEYLSSPEDGPRDIVIGAHETVLTYRDSSKGIPAGIIARSILPGADGVLTEGVLSERYPLEPLMDANVFEMHSFRMNECTILSFREEGNERRRELHVYPDKAPDGLLIRLEWKSGLGKEQVETEGCLRRDLKKLLVFHSWDEKRNWKPRVWLNGIHIKY